MQAGNRRRVLQDFRWVNPACLSPWVAVVGHSQMRWCRRSKQNLLFQFPRAAIASAHTVGVFKQQKFLR